MANLVYMKRILITLQLMLLVQLTIANPEASIDFKSNTSRASMMPVYTPETIESGSLIIDMGQVPQTTENALLPYGLVYALVKDLQVPVEWVISSSKSKDGTDFSADGMSFKGAPFIIKAEFITPAVLALVSTWEAMGVVTHTLASAAIAPIYSTINYVPGWTLDAGNGGIAEGYINNAGIPESAYNWKLPGELDCCDD